MNTAVVANGLCEDLDALRELLLPYKRIVAVDGGLNTCKALGINPSLLVGDFDSTSTQLLAEYKQVPKITLPTDKDQTDLEVALEHEFAQGAGRITLFGAAGHRLDHSATNLLLLSRYPGRLKMETERETVFAIQGEAFIEAHVGQTLSLVPLTGPVRGITTVGLKWELAGRDLDYQFVGISNVCLRSQVRIHVQDGILTCFLVR